MQTQFWISQNLKTEQQVVTSDFFVKKMAEKLAHLRFQMEINANGKDAALTNSMISMSIHAEQQTKVTTHLID